MGKCHGARARTPVKFEKWIEAYGTKRLAATLGVDYQTICNWRVGRCDPRACYMRRIKKLSRGSVGYSQMIDRGALTRGRA